MGRKSNCCQNQSGDIPAWFMTYSDVITLLMTFFILLLTFATNEPEGFQQMQVAAFGGRKNAGAPGPTSEESDADQLVLRYRPRSSRQTAHGSEMPAIEEDALAESLSQGLKALDEENNLAQANRIAVTISIHRLRDESGELTTWAQQIMRLLAVQLKRLPVEALFEVENEQDVELATQLVDFIIEKQNVPPGRVALSISTKGSSREASIRVIVARFLNSPED